MANIAASLTVICTQNVAGSTYVCIFEAEKNNMAEEIRYSNLVGIQYLYDTLYVANINF